MTIARSPGLIPCRRHPDEAWQMVLVDLPGVQKPRDVLTERMQRRVERELADSDAVLFVLNGEQVPAKIAVPTGNACDAFTSRLRNT